MRLATAAPTRRAAKSAARAGPDTPPTPVARARADTPGVSHSHANCACGGGCPRCQAQSTRDIVAHGDPVRASAHVTFDPRALHGGRRLTEKEASPMEAGFGQPLSHLLVHTDASGARLADALDAEALTVGPHLFFASDRSPDDRPLLAHEVAHALQQPARVPSMPMSVTQPGDASERAADQAAHAIGLGMPAHHGSATGAQIARKRRGLSSWAWEKLKDPEKFIDEVIEHPLDATVGSAGEATIEGFKQDAQEIKDLGSDTLQGMRANAAAIREGGETAERWLVERQKEGTANLYADAEEHADVPLLGSALQANAWLSDQIGQFGTGVTGGAVTLGSGLLSSTADPVDTVGGLLKLGNEVLNPFAEKGHALSDVGENLAKPYVRAIDEGRWSEASGRFAFDVLSMLVGGGEANAASKGSRAVPLARTGAKVNPLAKALPDLAKPLSAVDELARTLPAGDDLAKTLTPIEAGKTLTPVEAGKTLPQSPRQPYPTLNMPGAQRPHPISDYFKWSDEVLPKAPDGPVIDFPAGPFSPAEAVDIAKKQLDVKFPWDPPSPAAVGDTLPGIGPQPKPMLPTGSGPAFADTQRVPQPTLPGIGPEQLAKSALPEGVSPLTGKPPIPSNATEVLAAVQARRLVRPHYGTFHQEIWEYLGGKGPAPISYRLGNRWFIDGERAPSYLRDLVEDQIAGGQQRP